VAEGRTGAARRWPGQFELSANGTLYLEEITDLAANLQAKLLRVLEDGCYLPIGGDTVQKFSARIIVSTSKDLSLEMFNGRFREDLYYRISGVRLDVPDLTQRLEDIPELITAITSATAIEMHQPAKNWTPEAMTALMDYHWPGNIDELRQMIVCLLNVVEENTITLEHVRLFAPAPIASHFGTTGETGKSLRNLRPAQFWHEYLVVYHSRGKDMAFAYGVTEGALSHHKKKHEKFRPR
jgi:DNA-binding NtrC family response regulator